MGKLLPGSSGGNDGRQNVAGAVQDGSRLDIELQSPQHPPLIRSPLLEGHGDTAEMEQIFGNRRRAASS